MLFQKGCRLFSYPLPEPQNTAYHRLRIAPEATEEEIRDAKSRLLGQLTKRKEEINTRLSDVYSQVDGLGQIYKDIGELRSQGKDANLHDLSEKEKKLAELEVKAVAVTPDYKQLVEDSKDLQRRINELNQLNLEKRDERMKYNQETPPCALLRLESDEPGIFTKDRRLALSLLHSDLVDFLEQKGEECYHPSDLTRKNFQSDFTFVHLLDGMK
jgi:hypothetical protein